MDSIGEPVGGIKKLKNPKKNDAKDSPKSGAVKKRVVKNEVEAVDEGGEDSKNPTSPSKTSGKVKSPTKVSASTDKPKKKVVKKKTSAVAEADQEVEAGTNVGPQEVVRHASQVLHPGASESAAQASPVPRKVSNKLL